MDAKTTEEISRILKEHGIADNEETRKAYLQGLKDGIIHMAKSAVEKKD
jgi:hypothetical protein